MKPLVYVAGPITAPSPMLNTHEAIKVASELLQEGFVVPFLPHLTVLWDMVAPNPYETWMAYDFDVLRHCQALLRLPGDSPGADREIVHARELGIHVFYDTLSGRVDMNNWATAWSKRHDFAVSHGVPL